MPRARRKYLRIFAATLFLMEATLLSAFLASWAHCWLVFMAFYLVKILFCFLKARYTDMKWRSVSVVATLEKSEAEQIGSRLGKMNGAVRVDI